MRDHFFIANDGSLHDTRNPRWATNPLRPNFLRTYGEIESVAEFKATLRAGGFAWPGGCPMCFVTSDGGALSFESARENAREIISALMSGDKRNGWRVCACEINWENSDLVCGHSGKAIPSAYGEES